MFLAVVTAAEETWRFGCVCLRGTAAWKEGGSWGGAPSWSREQPGSHMLSMVISGFEGPQGKLETLRLPAAAARLLEEFLSLGFLQTRAWIPEIPLKSIIYSQGTA